LKKIRRVAVPSVDSLACPAVCTFDLIPSFLLESVSGRAHKAKNRNKNKQKLTRFFEFDFLELMTHTHIQSYISKTLTIMSV
jgi:hypothetical protein